MKKSILNLGKNLNRLEQKQINGGFGTTCDGYDRYYVNNCSECVNILLPGAPTLCHNNCCVMAH